MGLARADRWILVSAFALQVPIQEILFRYPLMPDTLPQPWYVWAAYETREHFLRYVEYPAIKLADAVYQSLGFMPARTSLFVAGAICLALLLFVFRNLLRWIGAISSL